MSVFGFHAVYEPDFAAAIRSAAAHGFQYVQFDLNVPRYYIDQLPHRALLDIKSMAADAGVRLTLHAPGDNVGLFTDYPAVRRGLLDHMRTVLDRANLLGARHLTVHPLKPPSFRRADTLEDGLQVEYADYFRTVLKENITVLAEAAGGVLLNIENCHLGPIATAALDELLGERTDFFLALDGPKMHKSGPVVDEAQRDFFLRHTNRIREIHLHDLDAEGRSHLRPGQSRLDFAGLFRRFYDGEQWLTVEVRPFAEALKAKVQFEVILAQAGRR